MAAAAQHPPMRLCLVLLCCLPVLLVASDSATAAQSHHAATTAMLGPGLLLFGAALAMAMVLRHLRVDSITAFLAAGFAIGPFGLGLVDPTTIAPLAEVGAMLLLFALGLEMDLDQLRRQWRQVAIGTVVQLVATIGAGMLLLQTFGLPANLAFVGGACLALSSTLLVLKPLERLQLRNRPVGSMVLNLALAQDMALAPLLVLVALAVPAVGDPQPMLLVLGGVITVVATIVGRRILAAHVVRRIRSADVPELEIAFAFTAAVGAAVLTTLAGLGAAVGAFCAGLALGGGEHRQGIERSTGPLQGLLAIAFFAAIGFAFDPRLLWEQPVLVLVGLMVSILVKAALAALALRLAGLPARQAIGGGLMLGQIGEFSFIIAARLIDTAPEVHRLIVAIGCLSLALTPVLIAVASRLLPRVRLDLLADATCDVVVAGLGPVGNTVVAGLRHAGAPLFLVDRNPRLLAPWQDADGVRCHVGRIEDVEDWLPVLGARPRVVVLTFPVADASALAARRLRTFDPHLIIIARIPFAAQKDLLREAGVDHVIADEEASAEALLPAVAAALGGVERPALRAAGERT
jgi:CPA2 family monovalent cation:H+ antiporter-2